MQVSQQSRNMDAMTLLGASVLHTWDALRAAAWPLEDPTLIDFVQTMFSLALVLLVFVGQFVPLKVWIFVPNSESRARNTINDYTVNSEATPLLGQTGQSSSEVAFASISNYSSVRSGKTRAAEDTSQHSTQDRFLNVVRLVITNNILMGVILDGVRLHCKPL